MTDPVERLVPKTLLSALGLPAKIEWHGRPAREFDPNVAVMHY